MIPRLYCTYAQMLLKKRRERSYTTLTLEAPGSASTDRYFVLVQNRHAAGVRCTLLENVEDITPLVTPSSSIISQSSSVVIYSVKHSSTPHCLKVLTFQIYTPCQTVNSFLGGIFQCFSSSNTYTLNVKAHW